MSLKTPATLGSEYSPTYHDIIQCQRRAVEQLPRIQPCLQLVYQDNYNSTDLFGHVESITY